jgi:hypothetical protein
MKQVIFLSLDSSQHFRGYHYPVLQVMLTERTLTNNQMADLIEYEINDNWDMYFYGYPEHQALYATFIAELRKDGEALFFQTQTDKYSNEYFETIENEEYLDDYLYFFFSIGEPNTVNGLTFCDK